jgi:hypothetical protein
MPRVVTTELVVDQSGRSLRRLLMTAQRTKRTYAPVGVVGRPDHCPGSHLIAAVQLDFPEAVVRARLDWADPNRSFAARQLDVSHADEPDRCAHGIGDRPNH